MYKTKNDIPEDRRTQLVVLLNVTLASSIDCMLNSKQAHWNVKGPQFIALHELFDEIHTSFGGYTDTIAERIVQLGGIAEGTAYVTTKRTKLKEYPLSISEGYSHVDYLSDSLAAFGKHVREGINQTTELGDVDAADILTEISRGVDKYTWFVEAHLEGKK